MAEEIPSLHIDTDWKKQAQAEKRKLAEQAAQAKTAPPSPPAPAVSPLSAGSVLPSESSASGRAGAPHRAAGKRELPPPGFPSLVQSMMTQVLFYLGEISSGGQTAMDLDTAKHQLDTLNMIEEKTKNNLTEEEQGLLDAALYETRSRFISVASQFLGP